MGVLSDWCMCCFLFRYAAGDKSIETDIVAALLDKSDHFNVRDITVLNELILIHQQQGPASGIRISHIHIYIYIYVNRYEYVYIYT